jgi:hypothetical protein
MVKTSSLLYDVLNKLSPASRLFVSQNYGNQLTEIVNIKEDKDTMENQVVTSEVVAEQCPFDHIVSPKLETVLFGDAAKIEWSEDKAEPANTELPLKDLVKKPARAKRVINRQKTNDGTKRSASQYIRDVDEATPGLRVIEVIELGTLVGLTIEPALVYNVRQNVKKKNGTWVPNDPEAAALTKQRRQAAAKKAREVRAAKRASKESQTVEDDVAVGQ